MANILDIGANGVEKYSSAALENAVQITNTQTVLCGFDGRNTDASNAVFIMAFDTFTTPTGSTPPVVVISVPSASTPGNGNFGYTTPTFGIKFTKGLFIGASSTDAPTYTAVATNKTFFHVQYARDDGVSAV